ncbi:MULTISPECIES: FtsB family cell division protein [unclassified Streptomyces]|uniref:FtsB family cell division protein n=1 Tax=unclassified Streptomyces TaxID=2593676 RepID=UPI0022B66176|nr:MULTISPECIES: septum formation initiator family protein [unclassified Streptomyces]MCZ7414682.1 septum formation initiator family protein [Streptomyces sp. WMMC897]MCZ7431611.1 septum formation initiator family protein [Streptomyces sp. WMMC1477]
MGGAPERERFSTATRLRALGEQAAERVYRAQSRRLRGGPRRSRLTGRAALLALVLCSLVVALAYPTRSYVSQRSDIAEERRKLKETEERVAELRELKARLQDPAYVEQLAREHLHYVRTGERGYIVRSGTGGADETDAPRHRGEDGGAGRAWYTNLFDGLDRADAG